MKSQFTPSFVEEKQLWDQGTHYVIGVDEVGVGAFAGPVVIAGVIFDAQCSSYYQNKTHTFYEFLHSIHDSKLLLPKVREQLAPLIQNMCLFSTITEIPVSMINTYGIRKATILGMQQVVHLLEKKIVPDIPHVLVDGFAIPDLSCEQKHLIKGDQKSISIAAASIIAKVYRDNLMEKLSKQYPHYYFERNKGYGTKDHREAIQTNGLSDIHRTSFNLLKFL